MDLSRPEPSRHEKKAILISLEDECSAKLYFEGFRPALLTKDIELVFADNIGSDPKSVVKAAKIQKDKQKRRDFENPFLEIWVVFDTEGQDIAREKNARDAIEQARQLKFKLAVSNPSFEYWFLLHFERVTKAFINGKMVVDELKKHLRKHEITDDYEKGKSYFTGLRDRTENAIKNSGRVLRDHSPKTHPCDCHPSTTVHLLVERLLTKE